MLLLLGLAVLATVVLGAGLWGMMSRIIRMELRWDMRLLRFGVHLFGLGVVVGAAGCLALLWHMGRLT